MYVVSVMYRAGTRFDADYYQATHIPLVRERFGEQLADVIVLRGLPGPDGAAPAFQTIALLSFRSLEDLQAAMGGEGGAEVRADVANFTDEPPTIQLSQRAG